MSDKKSRMAARKELLLARASIERMELAGHLGRVRSSLSPSSLFRSVIPPGTMGKRGPMMALNLFQTLRRYPVVTSAASMLLAKVSISGVLRIAKLSGGAFVAYQAFKVWRAIKDDSATRR